MSLLVGRVYSSYFCAIMIEIDNTLTSLDVVECRFVCDLNACKGACCVLGDSGAPLDENEASLLEDIYPEIEGYLRPESREAIAQLGKWVIDSDGDIVTPLVNGQECAYTIFEGDIAFCGIEKAYNDGRIKFRKPISCHLYPVRLKQIQNITGLNYHRWDICQHAISLGKKLDVPVYVFLKEPLIRKFGEDWYNQLTAAAKWNEENPD